MLIFVVAGKFVAGGAIETDPFVRAWGEDDVLHVVPGLGFVFGAQFAHGGQHFLLCELQFDSVPPDEVFFVPELLALVEQLELANLLFGVGDVDCLDS